MKRTTGLEDKLTAIDQDPYEAESLERNSPNCDFLENDEALNSCILVAKNYCLETDAKNPLEIALKIMHNGCTQMRGPEHHFIVGMALLAAYKNCGGKIDLEPALDALIKRNGRISTTCEDNKSCGASSSCGEFIGIISAAADMQKGYERGLSAIMVSRSLGTLSAQKGGRCCKRDSFISALKAVELTSKIFEVEMELPENFKCPFHNLNDECLKADCCFFPLA